MAHGIGANHVAAERVSNENVLVFRRDVREHSWELVHDVVEAPRRARRLAPGEAGPIVGADPREFCDFRLNDRPTEGGRGDTGFEKHHRTASPAADGMEAVASDVDQCAGGSKPRTPTCGRHPLIEEADGRDCDEKPNQAHVLIVDPAASLRNLMS